MRNKKTVPKKILICIFAGVILVLTFIWISLYLLESDYVELSKTFYEKYITLAEDITYGDKAEECLEILAEDINQKRLKDLENLLFQIEVEVPKRKYYYFSVMQDDLNGIKLLNSYSHVNSELSSDDRRKVFLAILHMDSKIDIWNEKKGKPLWW